METVGPDPLVRHAQIREVVGDNALVVDVPRLHNIFHELHRQSALKSINYLIDEENIVREHCGVQHMLLPLTPRPKGTLGLKKTLLTHYEKNMLIRMLELICKHSRKPRTKVLVSWRKIRKDLLDEEFEVGSEESLRLKFTNTQKIVLGKQSMTPGVAPVSVPGLEKLCRTIKEALLADELPELQWVIDWKQKQMKLDYESASGALKKTGDWCEEIATQADDEETEPEDDDD